MANQSIISTKINIPRVRTDIVLRPRILDILNEGVTRPSALTLISAPAGYGKTTLLVSWVCKTDHHRAWLSLEPEDDSFPRFVTYLVASLQKISPALGHTTKKIIDEVGDVSSQIDSIISSLLKDLSKYSQPTILVLEDYHYVSSRDIHKLVEEIAEHIPLIHLVVTTRHDPPLPLPRWRVRHQLIEIRTQDLQFTFEETSEFLKRVMRLEISSADVRALEGQTEGWAAGLQLAALSIRNHKNAAWKIDKGNRHTSEYLLTEIFNQLPSHRREFLLQTSLVHRLNSSLSNALTQRNDSQTTLEDLEADNLFLISLDDTREWFRYHHLFAEFLQKRLATEYSETTVQDLHKRASHWLGNNGYSIEAIDHAIAGRDYEYAACLIGPQCQLWMKQGEISTILKYLKRLPEDFAWKDWNLCLWYGWAYAVRGCLNPAEHWTNRLEEIITPLIQEATQKEAVPFPTDLQNAYVQVLGIRSILARQNKDFTSAVALGEQALLLVPEKNLHLKTVMSSLLSAAVLELGNFDQAESLLQSTRQNAYRTGNSFIVFNLLLNEAALAIMRGQLHRAHDLNNEALRFAQQESLEGLVFLPQFRLGRIHYFWNELNQAGQYIHAALEQADAEKYLNATVRGYITLAWIQNAEAQYPQALQTLEQAEQIALAQHGLESVEMVKGVRAQLQFSAGENEAVVRWAKSSDWELLESVQSRWILSDESFFSYCQILIASRELSQWKRAEHLLEWRLKDSQWQRRESAILKIRLLQALLHHTQNQPDLAMVSLVQALEIAMPENCIRPFLDEGRPLISYLRRVPREHSTRSFAQTILTYVHILPSQMLEPLSQQEHNILQLMAEGHTNPEIARKLLLAVSTVRWYVKQIFRKLGVHNRTQAAIEARKLNLL